MFTPPPPDRALVRIDFTTKDGTQFKEGQWLTGNLFWVGGPQRRLMFEDKATGIFILPDYFERFDLGAMTLSETFGLDLGNAEDSEEDYDDIDDEFDDEDEFDDDE